MSVQNETTKKLVDTKGGLTAGAILVTIGLGLLVIDLLSVELAIFALLALVFIVAGIVNRSAGLMIPGGIIGGVGLGITAVENHWFASRGTVEGGAVMLLSMAAGFLSIIVLSKLFTRETQLWPIFPAGGLALVGGLMVMGADGLTVLEFLGDYWPVILVMVGLSILVKSFRGRA
jgi:hypothetical protein